MGTTLRLVGLCSLLVLLCLGCTARQRAAWQAHSNEYWAAQRAYNAAPKTITTCKPWCFLDYCEYRCTTY